MNIGGIEVDNFMQTSKTQFVVPFYQRNYSWEIGQCAQLFSDIRTQLDNDKVHFLGSICFQKTRYKNMSSYVIIDGQQRLTSLSLFLLALKTFSNNRTFQQQLNNFLRIETYSSEIGEQRLILQEDDNAIYQKLLNLDTNSDRDVFTQEEKESHLYINYQFFINAISDTFPNIDGEIVYSLKDCLNKLEIASIEIQNENPQLIFESLNCTGLNLTQVDLIRNYLLMPLNYEKQKEMYQKYWLEIERAIGVENMASFFISYLILKKQSESLTIKGVRTHINAKNLYEAFKQEFPDMNRQYSNDIENCFKEMYDCMQTYQKIMCIKNIDYGFAKGIQKSLYEIFIILEDTQAMPLIITLHQLYEHEKINNQQFAKCLEYIISYIFRSKVCRTNNIQYQFAASITRQINAQTIDDKFVEKFKLALISGRYSNSSQQLNYWGSLLYLPEQLYLLIDTSTNMPFLDRCYRIQVYSEKEFAEVAVDYHLQQFRQLEIKEIKQKNIVSMFGICFYMNGAEGIVVDNGQCYISFANADIVEKPNFEGVHPMEIPVTNPDYLRDLTAFVQEYNWRYNYENKGEMLTHYEERMIESFCNARFLVPVKGMPVAEEEHSVKLEQKTTISIPSFTRNNQLYTPVFTDWYQFNKALSQDEWGGWIWSAKDLLSTPDDMVVINAGEIGFALKKDLIKQTLEIYENEILPNKK